MDSKTLANEIVAMFKAGKFVDVGDTYWADEVVSVESMMPPGMDSASRGIKAVRAKSKWFYKNNEITPGEVDGPYVNGDQFSVKLTSDIRMKATGQVHHVVEIALYTLKDGKIVEERFFS